MKQRRRINMTRRELLKIIFPEVEIDCGCSFISCEGIESCKTCKYFHYWDEPAVLSKTAVKSILNSIYGYNACLETNTYFVFGGRGNGKTYAQHLELIQQGWTQLPSIHNNIDWSTLNEIMSDAIVNGFEVKILNGTIYYREKQ